MNEEENVLLNETENAETQTAEKNEEEIELTDTTELEKNEDNDVVEENEKTKGRFLTDEEINDIVDQRVARKMKKIERDNEKKFSAYKETENILKSTLKVNNIEEVNQSLRESYEEQGINLPKPYTSSLTPRQIEILAKAEANDFIEDGYEAMEEEANRLATIGYKNLSESDKIVFDTIVEELVKEKDKKKLLEIGASKDLLEDKDFKKFRRQFTSNTPIEDIYSLFKTKQTKPKFENPGSMKNNKTNDEVKDYYTPEEASKFTRKDYDKNPKLLEAVENSMTKWMK